MSSPYAQLWHVVAGAVEDAFNNHPDYLTERGRISARQSIIKRVTGTVLGFAEQARGRPLAAATGAPEVASEARSGGAPFRHRRNSGDQPKENGGTPEVARREENLNMLNVVEKQVQPQGLEAFVVEGFTSLSPLNANHILREGTYDRQRKVSKEHVEVLADIMRRGCWEPKDKIDFALYDGRLTLVNGYHRMHAQVLSGKTILWTIVVHPCRSLDDVRSLYYKFDTNTRIRGAAQILSGVGFADETGLSKIMSAALYGAVPVIAAGFSKAPRDRDYLTTRGTDRRLMVAREYVPAAKRYEECLGRLPARVGSKFRSAGVTAVALVTLRYQPVKAAEFWKGAAENDGLAKGDPRLALHNDLISRAMNAGQAIQSAFVPAYAWNAWFEDREIKIIKVYSNRTPTIAGTPFED